MHTDYVKRQREICVSPIKLFISFKRVQWIMFLKTNLKCSAVCVCVRVCPESQMLPFLTNEFNSIYKER